LRAPRRCLRSFWDLVRPVSRTTVKPSDSHPRGCPTIHLSKSFYFRPRLGEANSIVLSAAVNRLSRDFFTTLTTRQFMAHKPLASHYYRPTAPPCICVPPVVSTSRRHNASGCIRSANFSRCCESATSGQGLHPPQFMHRSQKPGAEGLMNQTRRALSSFRRV
jgi:hypothetical protein